MITALWPRPHRRDMLRLLARVRRQADIIRALTDERDVLAMERNVLLDLLTSKENQLREARAEVGHLDATIARLRPQLLREWQ